MRKSGVLGLFGLVACAMLVQGEREANACGGCFHQEQAPLTESSVVNDHRMVFALSPQRESLIVHLFGHHTWVIFRFIRNMDVGLGKPIFAGTLNAGHKRT